MAKVGDGELTVIAPSVAPPSLFAPPAAEIAPAAVAAAPTGGFGLTLDAKGAVPLSTLMIPTCRVYNSAAITCTTAVAKTLTFDSELFDNASIHSLAAATSRLTAPFPGIYGIWASVEWAANAVGQRSLWLQHSLGSTIIIEDQIAPLNGVPTTHSVYTEYPMALGEYVEALVYQTSGGNLNVNASASYSPLFGMRWVAPLA